MINTQHDESLSYSKQRRKNNYGTQTCQKLGERFRRNLRPFQLDGVQDRCSEKKMILRNVVGGDTSRYCDNRNDKALQNRWRISPRPSAVELFKVLRFKCVLVMGHVSAQIDLAAKFRCQMVGNCKRNFWLMNAEIAPS